MLDRYDFVVHPDREGDWLGSGTKKPDGQYVKYKDVDRLQENNRELVKFLIKVKEEYNYAMFDSDRITIDDLIVKNKEQETNDRPTDKSTI